MKFFICAGLDGRRFWSGLYLFALFWLTACGHVAETALPTAVLPLTLPAPPTPQQLATPTGTLPPTPVASQVEAVAPTATPAATATAVANPTTLRADPGVPGDLRAAAQALVKQQPDQFAWVEGGPADVTLTLDAGTPLAEWVYVVAAPFATVEDDVTLPDLMISRPLFAAADVEAWDTAVFNSADPHITYLANTAEMVERAWAERPSLVILPFDQLRSDLKLLRLDGVSPLTAEFDPAAYPLTVQVNVAGEKTDVTDFLAAWNGPATNWDPGKLTRVAMTGVTALTRATAYQMEIGGILAPGTAVGPVLQAADIAHVSNEVSFTPDCPYPDPIGGTTFCSRESYFELLTWLGIDVVELTGNHINDWGTDALLHSLALYEAAGMAVFGGGADAATAQQPALFEHNGNRIAFVGCNPVGPAYAWAGEAKPGSRLCDDGFVAQIAELAAAGYQVMATLQYNEFYHYAPTAQQEVDFAELAQAGAAAVSGSQAHHAQGFAFVDGTFIHYGPGNLFFDQMDQLGTRQTFVDTYVFYDGRLLTVELWTGLIENYCCPREMTLAEREAVLTAVFQASGW
ncbi:MAG: CapA family protein [Anaerolineaceae bacterium]|nr:CapA family protein [Anaerolineaceae bacterium]